MPSPEGDAAVRRRLSNTKTGVVSVTDELVCVRKAHVEAQTIRKSSALGMFCVGNAVRSSLSIPEHSCPARARTPLAHLSQARLASASHMQRERPLVGRGGIRRHSCIAMVP